MSGHTFGQLSENTKKAVLEIIRKNPDKTSKELCNIIKNKANRCLSVRQVASVRMKLGQHSKKRNKRIGIDGKNGKEINKRSHRGGY